MDHWPRSPERGVYQIVTVIGPNGARKTALLTPQIFELRCSILPLGLAEEAPFPFTI